MFRARVHRLDLKSVLSFLPWERCLRSQAITAVLGFCSLLTTQCVHRVSRHIDAHLEVPQEFDAHSNTKTGQSTIPWWEGLHDPQLTDLIQTGLKQNFTVAQAQHRLHQTESLARAAKAPLWPALNLSGQYTRSAQVLTLPDPNQGGQRVDVTIEQERYQVSLGASYELDLWGRLRANKRAAIMDRAQAAYALQTAEMTLSAQIAETWYAYLVQKAFVALQQRQLADTQIFTDHQQKRYESGLLEALDVLQQQQQLQSSLAQLETAQATLTNAGYQLATLLGQAPANATQILGNLTDTQHVSRIKEQPCTLPNPLLKNAVATHVLALGAPADLLLHRPDLKALHAQVLAADYRLGAAIASQLPSIRLNLSAGYAATDPKDLVNSMVWNLISNLTQPIFEGGRLRAQAKAQRAALRLQIASLRQGFLDALYEVESSVVLLKHEERRHHRLKRQCTIAHRALKQAESRYERGLADFLRVLTARQSADLAAQNALASYRQLISYRIQLHRALGGQWVSPERQNTESKSTASLSAHPESTSTPMTSNILSKAPAPTEGFSNEH